MSPFVLPHPLFTEYSIVRPLTVSSAANPVFLVTEVSSGKEYALKLLERSSLANGTSLDELRGRSEGRDNCLNVPVRTGTTEDGRFFTISDYMLQGSLHEHLAAPDGLPASAVRALVRDLAAACGQLHGASGGRRIVHGDIKPSNVLVCRCGPAEADWEFRLGDFDSAALFRDGFWSRPLLPTVAYASPEALRGNDPLPAMDYWSFGMLLLESVLGDHPFGNDLTDDDMRSLLVEVEWKLSSNLLAPVRDEACRALIAGLLGRTPGMRWGAKEVADWLRGDTEAIVSGLRILEENAAAEPFALGSETAHTVSNVADTLLRSWHTASLEDDDLLGWLGELSPTAAERLWEARGMDPDEGLLHFCRLFHPGEPMPAVWRGEAVSAANLAAIAGRANAGDGEAASWLRGFLEEDRERHFTDYEGYDDVASTVSLVRRTADELRAAWDAVADAGGPRAEHDAGDRWIDATLIALMPVEPGERAAILEELFDPLLIMRRQSWFFVFGSDPDDVSPAQLFVLRSLGQSSLVEGVDIDRLDELAGIDPEVLRRSIVLPLTQRRLLSSLFVRAGAGLVDLSAGDVYAPGLGPSASREAADSRNELPRPGEQADGGPQLAMRVVRLVVWMNRPGDSENELYLAMLSWSGAEPGTRLVIREPGRILALRRLQTRMPRKGRMLLVIHRSAEVYLTRSWLGFRQRRPGSIRILMPRAYPARLRDGTAVIAPMRDELRDRGRGLLPVRARLLRPGGILLWPARGLAPLRKRLHGHGALLRITKWTARVAVSARQREYARRYLADRTTGSGI